ncbi:MAG: hypothetical protein F6K58_24560 [Symploca sp. SIO2E9]|nr:hypothetical protein [Symploca sp. SIO2E9]
MPKKFSVVEFSLWNHSRQFLQFAPLLPRCAFDEWGFVSDRSDRSRESNEETIFKRQNLVVEKYTPYHKAFNEYIRTCSNFFNQSEDVLTYHPYLRNGENTGVYEIAEQSNINLSQQARLSVLNLGDAWKAMPTLQGEFRSLLNQTVSLSQTT